MDQNSFKDIGVRIINTFLHNQQNWNLTLVFDHISMEQNPNVLVVNIGHFVVNV